MLQNRLFQGLLTSLVWAVAIGTAVYWVLSMPGGNGREAAGNVATSALVADAQGLRRLLGAVDQPVLATAAAAPVNTQYTLVGVVAGTQSGQGAALIAVNGQAARTVRVGQRIQGEEGLYLQSLQGRVAYLGPELAGQSTLELVLPDFTSNRAAAGAPPMTRLLGAQPVPLRGSGNSN